MPNRSDDRNIGPTPEVAESEQGSDSQSAVSEYGLDSAASAISLSRSRILDAAEYLETLRDGECGAIEPDLKRELQSAGLIEVLTFREMQDLKVQVNQKIELEIEKRKLSAAQVREDELEAELLALDDLEERVSALIEDDDCFSRILCGDEAIALIRELEERAPEMPASDVFSRAGALDLVLSRFTKISNAKELQEFQHAAELVPLSLLPGQSLESVLKSYKSAYDSFRVLDSDVAPSVVRTIIRDGTTEDAALTIYEQNYERYFTWSNEALFPLTEFAVRFKRSVDEVQSLYEQFVDEGLGDDAVILPLMLACLEFGQDFDSVMARFKEIGREGLEDRDAALLTVASFGIGKCGYDLVKAYGDCCVEDEGLHVENATCYAVLVAAKVASIPEIKAFQSAILKSSELTSNSDVLPLMLACLKLLPANQAQTELLDRELALHAFKCLYEI